MRRVNLIPKRFLRSIQISRFVDSLEAIRSSFRVVRVFRGSFSMLRYIGGNSLQNWLFKLTAVIALASLLSCSVSAQSIAPLSPEKITKIENAISTTMSRQSIPALSVAIVENNQIRFQRGYGVADQENSVPAKSLTVYRIASVSKAMTATAAMQLVEAGKLDLDAPVQKYVPGFPVKAHPITTRQLLTHLSGIRHYKQGEGEQTTRYATLTEALALFKDDPLLHEPETRYTYTTFGYTLLGAVIEGASGMNYADYMRERVFKPAGMTDTQFDDLYAIIRNRAEGYTPRVYARFDGNYRNDILMDASYKLPGGGFVSTAEDMARFAIAVQSGVLLKPETLKLMWTNQKTRDGRETGYGYGWYIGGRPNRGPGTTAKPPAVGVVPKPAQSELSVSHGGVQAGFTADLWLLPEKKFAVTILTNLEGGGRLGLAELANQIADIVQTP